MTSVPFPDRDTIASKLASLDERAKSYVVLLMENAAQDENVIDGLYRHLNNAASAPFVNTPKFENLGKRIGEAAPAFLQIRLMEAAKSSHHPAYVALRTGHFAFRRGGKGLPAGSDLMAYYRVAARPTERPAS
ncbi:hypothetical protein LPU83_2113 [Rhizobium favelukesii]|uniref:Uncharacterized protein n=1 Tax=Rhizobium favelukesii TaxID=348824 RepID=W6RBS3_9HYPH|nr:hypothetical protein LPU83_2113 [Rhizobium favelukesii]